MAEDKRYAFLPLSLENSDRALEGELILDRENGDVWTKTKTGELVSSTSNLSDKVKEILSSGLNSMSYAFNNNRRVYRFYFEGNVVRLDRQLQLDPSIAYFRIRDIANEGKYYVNTLTNVKYDAASAYPFVDNETYFVEFYTAQREMVTNMIFSAKYGPNVLQDGEPDKIVNRLEVHTNKDFLYVGETLNSLIHRVYLFFEDGSSKDVTAHPATILQNLVDNKKVGVYKLVATHYFDTTHGQFVEASHEVMVREDIYAKLIDMVIVPRKIVHLNDGSRSIRLSIIGYFEDGAVRNLTDEVIVSDNFDDTLFNAQQYITVKFNAGHLNVIEKNVELLVKDDGSGSENTMYYRDNILMVDPEFVLPSGSKYFRVRDARDLSFFYTIGYAEVDYDAPYMEKPALADRVHNGTNFVVEFFNETHTLLDSTVFSAEYRAEEEETTTV